jgi:ATP-dependent 26S proteasome regulatory subunit
MHNLLSFLDNPPTVTIDHNGKTYEVAIVVATTNYYDKLDGAVKRYGRFDKKVEMNYFNRNLADKFCKIYDLKLEDVIPKKRLPIKDDFTIAPAELEALCIANIDKGIKG